MTNDKIPGPTDGEPALSGLPPAPQIPDPQPPLNDATHFTPAHPRASTYTDLSTPTPGFSGIPAAGPPGPGYVQAESTLESGQRSISITLLLIGLTCLTVGAWGVAGAPHNAITITVGAVMILLTTVMVCVAVIRYLMRR